MCKFLAYLETHDKEKHDHQSIVNPVVEIHMQSKRADVDTNVLMPQVEIGKGQRRIRSDEGEDRDDDEQHGRARLRA